MPNSGTLIAYAEDLIPGARNAIRTCLRVRPDERVVIVTDRETDEIASSLADQVREVIANSSSGITADDVARRLNRSILSVRPRVSELRRLGEIRQSGARGKNESGMSASMWVIAPPLQPEYPSLDHPEAQK